MIDSDQHFTVVFADLSQEERERLVLHPKFSASSWSHALDDRDNLLTVLAYAEAALADIGDADREPGDDMQWAEERAAAALPRVRRLLAAHGINRTSLT